VQVRPCFLSKLLAQARVRGRALQPAPFRQVVQPGVPHGPASEPTMVVAEPARRPLGFNPVTLTFAERLLMDRRRRGQAGPVPPVLHLRGLLRRLPARTRRQWHPDLHAESRAVS
jgi:hypothetical protein